MIEQPLNLQPEGVECQCMASHSPTPLVLEHHHIWPQEFNGPTVPENMIWICATTHNTVHTYLRIFLALDQVLSSGPLRDALRAKKYPPYISRYAMDLAHMGYLRIKAGAINPSNTLEPRR